LNNRIRYTGQQYDELTEQYYLRARYYNPVAGRFMQEDVYQGDGLNLYAYCGNNPVVYDDPSGYARKACPPKGKISESVDESDSNTKTLFRGDRASVVPDDVFKNGFKPKGTHNDALLHTKSNTTAGNFVSTSGDIVIATEFAGKNGYVYVIRTNNYVDINSIYGAGAYFPEQMEFSIPGGIKPYEIVGAYKKQGGKIIGDFIPNPNFGGN
ncbi:RHS repeat-associated core domain-containing protein, partial [Waltera intestinalis]